MASSGSQASGSFHLEYTRSGSDSKQFVSLLLNLGEYLVDKVGFEKREFNTHLQIFLTKLDPKPKPGEENAHLAKIVEHISLVFGIQHKVLEKHYRRWSRGAGSVINEQIASKKNQSRQLREHTAMSVDEDEASENHEDESAESHNEDGSAEDPSRQLRQHSSAESPSRRMSIDTESPSPSPPRDNRGINHPSEESRSTLNPKPQRPPIFIRILPRKSTTTTEDIDMADAQNLASEPAVNNNNSGKTGGKGKSRSSGKNGATATASHAESSKSGGKGGKGGSGTAARQVQGQTSTTTYRRDPRHHNGEEGPPKTDMRRLAPKTRTTTGLLSRKDGSRPSKSSDFHLDDICAPSKNLVKPGDVLRVPHCPEGTTNGVAAGGVYGRLVYVSKKGRMTVWTLNCAALNISNVEIKGTGPSQLHEKLEEAGFDGPAVNGWNRHVRVIKNGADIGSVDEVKRDHLMKE